MLFAYTSGKICTPNFPQIWTSITNLQSCNNALVWSRKHWHMYLNSSQHVKSSVIIKKKKDKQNVQIKIASWLENHQNNLPLMVSLWLNTFDDFGFSITYRLFVFPANHWVLIFPVFNDFNVGNRLSLSLFSAMISLQTSYFGATNRIIRMQI